MKKCVPLLFALICCVGLTYSQESFPTNGAPNPVHTIYALSHAVIYVSAEQVLNDATIVIKDGTISAVGTQVNVPKDAVVIDLKGKYIYPAFIDLCSSYGIPNLAYEKQGRGPHMETSVKGAYAWNMAIRSTVKANELFRHDGDAVEELRKAGFGAVLTSGKDGIVRGSAAFVTLNSSKKEHQSIVVDRAAAIYSFDKGSSPMDYPQSLTGAIALLRQSLYDAKWYAENKPSSEYNISLAELSALQKLPSVFETNDKYNILRAAAIAKEFSIPFIVKGGGDEYQRLDELKASGLRLIVPINFPEAIDVEDPFDAQNVSLAELKHWELAPYNLTLLEKAGLTFAITSADLKDKNNFIKNLRKAVQNGLSEKTALKALTSVPAAYLGLSQKIGALQPGMLANLIITSGNLFDEQSSLLENWSAGERNIIIDASVPDYRAQWTFEVAGKVYNLSITGDYFKPKASIKIDTTKKVFNFRTQNKQFSFSFSPDTLTIYRGDGFYNETSKQITGRAQLQDGNWTDFSINYKAPNDSVKKQKVPSKPIATAPLVVYPFSAYGYSISAGSGSYRERFLLARKPYSALLIKNTTVWTNTADSILQDVDVLITDNRISKIAKGIIAPPGAKIIDGKGKHLSPGIIDEHSHIALTQGVNEGTQASSAEVRMGDVINPEDINIYRQLSGGVVAAQLLHGSANPIGGQSAIIKLRWGLSAEDMKITGARPFIKFALGENVKQSNWGDHNNVRFPQSRMGVEQVYYDFFTRAKEYDAQKNAALKAGAKSKFAMPRKDLELEALAEIIAGKRFITCHSYVQSEINMLMHVADSFGFKVNTFTHILEGYKVADKMKAHGVAASTFSDWWAYKNEVMDAIPYNAALLTKVGVVTAINSDDAEMARRLNQEAAKCVKYGGLTEVAALKLVTLNPAIMLHLENDMGTIAEGKSADVVLWSDNPLSVYAKADYTIIDGVIYFDRQEDAAKRAGIQAERARLVNLLLAEKQKGMPVIKPSAKKQQLYHCNTIEGVSESITGER